jgi:uncharacterized Zn finger protein (UPF0148 family)
MSDFDKEAERQKLREKFEKDREKRKETERMSQLLLQGATMTNRHCDTCGDPLFRYQGQVFCATCEGRAQAAEAEAEAGEEQAQQTQAPNAAEQPPETETGADTSAGETGRTAPDPERGEATTDGVSALDADAAGHPAPRADSGRGEERARGTDAGPRERPETTTRTPSPGTTATRSRTDDDADGITAAYASLVRTLTHHAQQAEAADGPRRATDHLTAAREAAEALAALDRGR